MDETGVPKLLDAVVAIAQDLSLPDLLRKIVRVGGELVGAPYGVLGVLGPDGTFDELVEHYREGPSPLPERDGEPPRRLSELHAAAPEHPLARSFLEAQIRVRDRLFGYLGFAGKDEFSAYDEEVLAGLGAAAGVAIENATLFDEVQRRERWLEASYHVTGALLAEQDLVSTLRLIAERARVVAGGSAGAVARPLGPDRAELVFEVVEPRGQDADRLAGLRVPTEGTATGLAFTSGHSVVVRDYGEYVEAQQRGKVASLPAMVRDLDSTIAVPLIVGDETLGVLLVAKFRDKTPFTDFDVQLAETFAAHAALAVEFARAQEDRQRLAVFQERDRIARDLHDLVIQRLFATGLGLEGLSRMITEPAVADRVTGFVQDLDRTIREIRNSIFSLQEPEEVQGSLRSELLRVALDSGNALGFEPRIGFDGPLDAAVGGAVRGDLVAALRESLSNVARHAGATEVAVDVAVDRSGHELRLTVADDGAGIPEDPARHSGLANLAERAARWGGTFSARRLDGGGTGVEWTALLKQSTVDTTEEAGPPGEECEE
ncbi:GAF domain-containing sensor histidine kinase [Amycolatopsis sp. NPDC058986]|uniref:GAF domain-containing sensor histidine kinase n=1 Tax=unclassified Amycolatopsis TaxID=2618356 RepID=UPI003671613A